MDKKQEEKRQKYEDRHYKIGGPPGSWHEGWEDCCKANGIGEDYSNPPKAPCGHDADKPCDCELHKEEMPKSLEHGAPEWVIDMMRTGKPVKCYVQRYIKDELSLAFTRGRFKVTGYSIHKGFRAAGKWWDEAIPEDKADTEKFKGIQLK